jgi:hypothetical protein
MKERVKCLYLADENPNNVILNHFDRNFIQVRREKYNIGN